jgi:hypothetical protein
MGDWRYSSTIQTDRGTCSGLYIVILFKMYYGCLMTDGTIWHNKGLWCVWDSLKESAIIIIFKFLNDDIIKKYFIIILFFFLILSQKSKSCPMFYACSSSSVYQFCNMLMQSVTQFSPCNSAANSAVIQMERQTGTQTWWYSPARTKTN